MRRLLRGFAWAIPGYLVGAFGGGALISVLSSNTHDGSVEAAMTGAFVTGPLLAVVAFAVGAIRAGAPTHPSTAAHVPGTPPARD